ncbi:MAG TPA: hypothetical protein VKP13_04775 [Nitrospira sp.]|nr:hypothetical protein [Nitrospira sp.]
MNRVIAKAWLLKVRDDQLKHFSCKGQTSPSLRNLAGTKGTGSSHCGWIRREADGWFRGHRLHSLRGYRICSGARHVYGETQSLCIRPHRIKILALGAVGIDDPYIHKAAVVRERWLWGLSARAASADCHREDQYKDEPPAIPLTHWTTLACCSRVDRSLNR